jgi:transcriptional regulator with XRE-family HTH domain
VTTQIKIGAKIRDKRLSKNISQENLAELSNIDRTYLQSIEKGMRNISVLVLQNICLALDCKLSDFLKEIDL